MADVAGIPRTRGAVSGLLLILLGAWGGLVPFVGPYFHFEFSPDKAWAYNSGRLYLSVIPGAVTLLAGLFILLTRSRAAGVLWGFLAALSGAWFIAGSQVAQVLLNSSTITPGTPAGTPVSLGSGAVRLSTRMFAEQLGFFTGLGIAIIFIAAIAIGRFSLLAARDTAAGDAAAADSYPADGYPAEQAAAPAADNYAARTGPYTPPRHDPFGAEATSQFPAATEAGQFRLTPAGQFPQPGQQLPAPAEQAAPAPAEPNPPAQDQFPEPAD